MQSKSPISPRKKPVQNRSKHMVDVILTGAARILIEEGYEAFTTNRVAEVAGVSIGSLYQYFPNKAALIASLTQRHDLAMQEAVTKTVSLAEGQTLGAVIRQLISNHIAIHQIEPELHRVLNDEIPKLGNLDWQKSVKDDIQRQLVSLLDRFVEPEEGKNRELLIFILINMVEVVVYKAILERPQDILSGAIEDNLVEIVLNLIQHHGYPAGL